MTEPPHPRLTPGARRILEVASELFYRHGIHAVGVDTIAAESGVTKRTLYDRFGSKDTLVRTYLQHRHDTWWTDLQDRLDAAPHPRTLVMFDAYTDAPRLAERGCAFLNAAGELPVDHPAHEVVRSHKQAVRERLGELISDDHPEVADPEGLAHHLFLILEGAVVHRGVDGHAELIGEARTLWCDLLPRETAAPR